MSHGKEVPLGIEDEAEKILAMVENLTPEQIAKRAYFLYEKNPSSSPDTNWCQAEKTLRKGIISKLLKR